MKITIIGAGAMGGAIAEGLIKSDVMRPSDLTRSDHHQETLDHFSALGASTTLDNCLAVKDSDIVFVVVKPWCVEKTIADIKDELDDRQLLIVVAAGITSAQLQTWLGKRGESPSLFLAMPNIAIAYKASMTYLTPVGATEEETQKVVALFDELGESILLEESLYPAATALSCSIAYAMRYARASVEGAVELGFKAKLAQKIVLQTMAGAVELLKATGEHPEAAIDKVTTPGGLTIRGLNEMEHAGFSSAVIRGMKAGKPQK